VSFAVGRGVTVCVRVGDGRAVAVDWVGDGVPVGFRVGVAVRVGVPVGFGAWVDVALGVGIAVQVAVGVGMPPHGVVAVRVAVQVGVYVGRSVGRGVPAGACGVAAGTASTYTYKSQPSAAKTARFALASRTRMAIHCRSDNLSRLSKNASRRFNL